MSRPLTILSALAVLLVLGPAARAATVAADFGVSEAPKLKVGFLHSLSESAPSDGLLLPLGPTAWRSNDASAPAARVRGLGASHTIVLSDHWSYPTRGWRPAGPPWTQLEGFAVWVRQFAQRYKGRGPFYWDIWNEPDQGIFWDGTRRQFYETFAVAERVLREELGPDARIVGPSTSTWRLDWIEGLADFCLERGCHLDAVSWHDLPDDLRSLPRLSERVETTRALLSQPRYRPLGVREFHLNEIMGQGIQLMPAAAVGYFSELEAARADVAIKSCWPEPSGPVNCDGQTLDGVLDWDTGRPRSIWYSWRAYTDGRPSRVRARSSDPRIPVLASRQSRRPGEAQLLIANTGTPKHDATVRICGLRQLTPSREPATRVRARIERHPDTEEAPFTPTLESPPNRLNPTSTGHCAAGRLPLPDPGGALVAYLRVR
jgi:xylan 1,4-beta-xylosidase